MSITVGDIYGAFPGFRPDDMIKLCNGNTNLNGRTVVSLSNIAAFGNEDLSIFATQREGKSFTNLLSKDKGIELNKAAGVQDQNKDKTLADNNAPQSISMDTSVFDIAAKKKQYA